MYSLGSQLMTIFYSHEWLEKVLRDKRLELDDERRIHYHIEHLRQRYIDRYYMVSISQVKESYDKFREIYANWYMFVPE